MRLGRSAVNLVGKENIRKNGSFIKEELLLLGMIDMRSGNIGGHEVGCELNSVKLAAKGRSEAFRKQRFSKARYAFDKHVSARKNTADDSGYKLLLPDEQLRRLGSQILQPLKRRFYLLSL
jgi:hypothetical protein